MKRRRSIYLINKRYQYKYVGLFVVVAAIAILSSAILLVNNISRQIESYLAKPVFDVTKTGQVILPIVIKESALVSVLLLVVLAAMSFVYYLHTKRLGVSIGECVGLLKNGELHCDAMLGCGEDFKGTREAFNYMFEKNRQKVLSMQAIAADIEIDIGSVEKSLGANGTAGAEIARLEGMISEMDKILSGFRLE